MALKVIGAGEGRTGTMSIKLALEQLGFGRCHHMSEVLMNPPSGADWMEAMDGRPNWEKIFNGYASAIDAPSSAFWRELAMFYPDAKIILSMRDAQSWFESTQETIWSPQAHQALAQTPLAPFFKKLVSYNFGPGNEGRLQDRDFMIGFFNHHNDEVKRTIREDRLLVYDVKQGWEPLCRFLDVSVPDAPFPRANTRDEMKAMLAGKDGGAANFDKVQNTLRDRLR